MRRPTRRKRRPHQCDEVHPRMSVRHVFVSSMDALNRLSQTLMGSDSLFFSSSPCERKVLPNAPELSTGSAGVVIPLIFSHIPGPCGTEYSPLERISKDHPLIR